MQIWYLMQLKDGRKNIDVFVPDGATVLDECVADSWAAARVKLIS